MYVPKHFQEPDRAAMSDLVQAFPLATLVTMSSSGLNANHIPLRWEQAIGPHGALQGHIARANPLWTDLAEHDALAIFHGHDAYITPNWYPTKQETGRVVPTWNYTAVHLYGRIRTIEDPAWLLALLQRLTDEREARFTTPWRVSDAPAEYIEKLIGAIVGIEMEVTRAVGKWKTSQNQPAANREGAIEGLTASGEEAGAAMAALIAATTQRPM